MKLYIGENLKRLRLERGLTQESLADRLGVSFQSVSRWETDQSYPDVEMIPEIAAFFGISTDVLMGVDKAMMNKRYLEYWEKASRLETEEEKLEHYREMRRRYPTESIVLHCLIDALAHFPEYIDEQRRLTEEYLRLTDTGGTSRDAIISTLIASEDEDKLPALLDKYATRYDQMSRASLLATRFFKRGDEEMTKKYFQIAFLEKLNNLEYGFVKYGCVKGGESHKRPLELFNMLTGTMGMSLTTGDGVPDLWFSRRLMFGFRFAEECVEKGDIESAFSHLEDIVSLYERFYSLPADTTLTFRCPEFSGLRITLKEDKCSPAFERANATPEELEIRYKCFRATAPNFGIDLMLNETDLAAGAVMDHYHLYCPEYDIYPLIAKYGWEGFDPIRDDPRFVALVDRMRKFIVRI